MSIGLATVVQTIIFLDNGNGGDPAVAYRSHRSKHVGWLRCGLSHMLLRLPPHVYADIYHALHQQESKPEKILIEGLRSTRNHSTHPKDMLVQVNPNTNGWMQIRHGARLSKRPLGLQA